MGTALRNDAIVTACTCQDQPPISDLDAKLDDLVRAFVRVPDLEELITGIEGYELLLGLVPIDAPSAVDAVAVAAVWKVLAEVAREVTILGEVPRDGNS